MQLGYDVGDTSNRQMHTFWRKSKVFQRCGNQAIRFSGYKVPEGLFPATM